MAIRGLDQQRWQRIDEVFQGAAELAPERRSAFLDQRCRGDAALRAEVEALLAHDAAGIEILDSPRGLSLASEVAPPVCSGERIGPWQLGERVGEGGGGVVFEAQRADERYERRVAIKFLKQALLTRRAVARFQRECRILGQLEHPHIARLYDAGTTDSGVPYIVLEWVDGARLSEWRRQSQPSLDQRLSLFSQICGAVAFAHRKLVVHRDLKPGNLLVTAASEPKLLDFGIARVLSGGEAEEGRLTRSDQQPMTPQYASPEQLRGEAVTTASDVYSLGLVLFELLTGSLPYELAEGWGDVGQRLADGRTMIRPPSAVESEAGAGAVSSRSLRGDLDLIVLTALEVDPQRRYGSAQALQEDVERFRQGLPIVARGPSTAYIARRFVGRHRLAVSMIVLLLVLLLGFAGSMVLAARRLQSEQARTAAEAATAQQVVRFLGGLFEGAEPAVHQGRELTARQLLDRGAAEWAEEQNQPPATRAALAAAIGKAYLELSLLAEARSFLETALALRRDLAQAEPLAESHRLLARLEWSGSDFQAAAQHAEAAVELLRPVAQPLPLAEALVLVGRARGSLGDLAAAQTALEEALSWLEPDPEGHPALAGIALSDLGSVMLYRGEVDRAGELVRRSIDLLTAAHGRLHPEVFDARRLLSAVVDMSDSPAQSELASLEHLLADQRTLYGEAHEQMVWTLVTLAGVRVKSFELEEAVALYRQARAMQQKVFGEDHLTEAVIESGLGLAHWRLGRRQEAVAAYERAVRVSRKRVLPGSYDLAMPVFYLGRALAGVGRCKEALPLLEEAGEAFEQVLRVPNFAQISSGWNRGYCLWQLGEQGVGEELMRGALAQAEERGYEESEELEYRMEMGEWRDFLGDPAT
ncbi:MAG: serine/threonine-protein kinase [Acidobacteriota bacterium]